MKIFQLAIIICLWSINNISFSQKAIELKSDEIFGSIKARQIGPAIMSGRITDLEGHPSNSKIIYVGTAGGGVWQSNNAGVTYNSIFDNICDSRLCTR